MFLLYMGMQINSSLNKIDNTKKANATTFSGLSQLLDASTINSFWKKVQLLGDVTIFEKVRKGAKTELIPRKVSLVRTKPSKKGDLDSKICFALYEKGIEKVKGLNSIDSKELGLMELKYKSLRNLSILPENELEKRSVVALQNNYEDALKVLYLISHENNKYKGIGSSLLDCAAQKSDELGLGGRVFLYSENKIPLRYLKNADAYMRTSQKSPTGFYYNYGFRADNATNVMIEKAIAQGQRPKIDGFTMFLPKQTAKMVVDKIKAN